MDDDELLAELGGAAGSSDITELRHVRTSADKRAAEEIANRQKCEDFEQFKPLFEQVQKELEAGVRQARRFQSGCRNQARASCSSSAARRPTSPKSAKSSSTSKAERDARLRVIFDNGTESNLLLRSFQRALYKDEAGRRITEPESARCSTRPKARKAIWRAARSMSCAASPTIR